MVKFYPSWYIFLGLSLVGVGLVISGDNWFVVWLGFELTLVCFLPMFSGGSVMVEGLIMYFLVQAGGSGVFALSFMYPGGVVVEGMFMLSMLMKLGMFPFYSWVPLVMSSVSWGGCLLLGTVQKVGPLFVICGSSFFLSFPFLLCLSVLSILVSGVLGYNQSYMRSLMAYSSVSHTGWMVLGFVGSFGVFLVYLVVYFFLLTILFCLFSFLKINKVVGGGKGLKYWGVSSVLMLSLSGVPPFTMFYLKVAILYFMVGGYAFIPFVLFGAIFSIYYYLTFIVPSLAGFWCESKSRVSRLVFLLSLLVSLWFPLAFFL